MESFLIIALLLFVAFCFFVGYLMARSNADEIVNKRKHERKLQIFVEHRLDDYGRIKEDS